MLTHRHTRLGTFIRGLRDLHAAALVEVVRQTRYPVLMREAALCWLVWHAPLEVTQGAPFAQRRRYVRRYYGV